MSGLIEEELNRCVKQVLIDQIKDMIMNDEYVFMESKTESTKNGYKEKRLYTKPLTGFGVIKVIFVVHDSGGAKYIDEQVFSWCYP